MHPAFVAKLRLLAPQRSPTTLDDEAAQKAFLEGVAERAVATGFVSQGVHGRGKNLELHLESNVPAAARRYSAERISVQILDRLPELRIGWGRATVALLDEEHAGLVLERIRERLLLDAARTAKREKLRGLRVRALEGRLDAVASARGVEYAVEAMHGKVQLTLKLDERRELVVDLPYRAEPDDVDAVGPLLDDVRALFARGLRFDVRPLKRWAKWKKPRTP